MYSSLIQVITVTIYFTSSTSTFLSNGLIPSRKTFHDQNIITVSDYIIMASLEIMIQYPYSLLTFDPFQLSQYFYQFSLITPTPTTTTDS